MVTNTVGKSGKNSKHTKDEPTPFFSELPYGYQKIAEYECICNYDFYDTGDEDKVNGCGGIFYRRLSISPSGIMHNERTACPCVLEYQKVFSTQHQLDEKKLVIADVDRFFYSHNLLNDQVHKHMTLNNFKCQNKSHKDALIYLKQYQLSAKGICLYGYAGRGKTHLAVGLAKKIQQQGFSVLAIKSVDLLNRIRKTYGSNSGSTEFDITDTLKKVDLLVIDDIGIEKNTDWVTQIFYEVIDYRYKRKPNIFTTNLTGGEMENKVGVGLVSRIWGAGERFEIEGNDWRIKEQIDSWLEIGREVT